MRTYLNDNWEHFSSWSQDIFTCDGGEAVRLPHTNVQTPFNCFDERIYQFVSGYRRTLRLEKVVGKYLLTFEGVAHFCEVFVNGESVATHNNGYTAFTVDVTSTLRAGNNQIVVKVDSRECLNQPPFGHVIDYLTYGGMYREAYLDNFVGAYVSDAFVIAKPNEPIAVDVTLDEVIEPTLLTAEILEGNVVISRTEHTAEANSVVLSIDANCKLWSLQEPNVYTLRLSVKGNEYSTTFGVRSAKFTKDGFFLNGERVKIVGLNRHQSFPYVGYAMPESMQRRDAQILKKQLCVNAVRTSHYPQSQYFVDECDRLGLLVFTEIPGWQFLGDGRWKDIAADNVKEMVLQYRNHPSVVLWGVRINESLDCDELYEKTNALAHRLDPTRQTGGVRYLRHSHLFEDVYTYNDFNRAGATDRSKICEKNVPYLVTEYNGHMFPTKSYDDLPHRTLHTMRYAKMLDGVFADKTTCGAFGWCMFDYNTHKDFGSGDRICYHGVMDMFRNPKMAAGVFSSLGNGEAFLEACFSTDIGDYPEGNVDNKLCLTNADSVEVFRGDKFVKKYTHKDSPYKHLPNAPILIDDLIGDRLTMEDSFTPKQAQKVKRVIADIKRYGVNDVPNSTKLRILRIMKSTGKSLDELISLYNKYENNWGGESGSVTLRAFKNGKVVAEKTVSSVQEIKLEISVSSNRLTEKTTYDVAAVNIRAVDQNGNTVPYVSKVLHFKTEGAVELIGEKDVPLLGGMSGTYVKTTGQKGEGFLHIDEHLVKFTVE